MAALPAVSQVSDRAMIQTNLALWQSRISLKKIGRGHHYVLDGAKKGTASVTTVLGCRVSPRLIDWSSKVEREACAETAWRIASGTGDFFTNAPAILRGVDPTEEVHSAFIARFHEFAGKERENQKQLREAGELGTEVHALIEWDLRRRMGQPIPEPKVSDRAIAVFGNFEKWAESVDLEPVALEFRLFHERHNYGGTGDLAAYATFPSKPRGLYLGDWKTSKGIWPEQRIQIGAYRGAWEAMGLPVAGGFLLHLPKEGEGVGTVQVVEVEEPVEELMDAFLACQRLHQFFGRYR